MHRLFSIIDWCFVFDIKLEKDTGFSKHEGIGMEKVSDAIKETSSEIAVDAKKPLLSCYLKAMDWLLESEAKCHAIVVTGWFSQALRSLGLPDATSSHSVLSINGLLVLTWVPMGLCTSVYHQWGKVVVLSTKISMFSL